MDAVNNEIVQRKLCENIGLHDELEIWEKAQSKFKENSKEHVEIDKNIQKLREQIDKEAYTSAVKSLEDRAKLESLTNTELIFGYEKVLEEFAVTEEQKLEITQKITSAQEEEVIAFPLEII